MSERKCKIEVVYTLSVVDGDTTLVASEPIDLKSKLNYVRVGEGIEKSISGLPDVEVYSEWKLLDGREFKLWPCSPIPTNAIDKDKAILVWQRTA